MERLKALNKLTRSQMSDEIPPCPTFIREITLAETSLFLKDSVSVAESVATIEHNFSVVYKCSSNIVLLNSLIDAFQENGCDDIALRLLVRQQKVYPSTEIAFGIGLSYFHIKDWQRCIESMTKLQDTLEGPSYALLKAKSLRVLS